MGEGALEEDRSFRLLQTGTGHFFSLRSAAEFVEMGQSDAVEYPVYLYRLTERGTVSTAAGTTSYELSDEQATIQYTPGVGVEESWTPPADVYVPANNVSGISAALTQEAIDGVVTQIDDAGSEVILNAKVNMTAVPGIVGDSKSVNSMTVTVEPVVETEDGTEPVKGGVTATLFDKTAISVTETVTIKARAYNTGDDTIYSDVASFTYTADAGLLGDVNGGGIVSASDTQRIYAHLNGSNPLS